VYILEEGLHWQSLFYTKEYKMKIRVFWRHRPLAKKLFIKGRQSFGTNRL